MSKKLIGYDMDDILRLANLQRRHSVAGFVLPALGLVLGAAMGAAVGLMFAPSSGRRFRQEVGERIDQMRERVVKNMNNSQVERTPINATSHGPHV